MSAFGKDLMTAEQLIAIKARVKAEMARRCHMGSLAEYATNTYDFAITPTAGELTNATINNAILAEQGQKVTDLLLKINDFTAETTAKTVNGDITYNMPILPGNSSSPILPVFNYDTFDDYWQALKDDYIELYDRKKLLNDPKYNLAKFKIRYAVINLSDLNRFEDGAVVTPELLKEMGLLKNQLDGVKVLGNGTLEKKLVVKAHNFSSVAKEQIEKLGGKAEVI